LYLHDTRVEYLGYGIDEDGLHPTLAKVEVIQKASLHPTLANVEVIQKVRTPTCIV